MWLRKLHYGWIIMVIGVFVIAGAVGFGKFSFSMLIPAMQRALGLSHEQAGIIASANTLGAFCAALVAGWGASRFGPKLIIITGLSITGLALALTAAASGVVSLLFCRFLAGVGSSFGSIAIMGLASSWFTAEVRGMALGFIVGGSGIAMMVMGWLVPMYNLHFQAAGWRYSWLTLAFILLGITLLAAAAVKNQPKQMGLLPIGAKEAPLDGGEKESVCLTIYDMMRRRTTLLLAVIHFCFGVSYIIYTMFFVNYMISERNISESLAGSIWGIVGLLSVFSAVIWGVLSDKFGRGSVLAFVFLAQTASYLLPLSSSKNAVYLWLSAVVFGFVAWSVPGIMASCCGDYAGPKNAAALLGYVTFFNGLGCVLGPIAAGFIKESNSSFSGAFLLAAFLACCGALGSVLLGTRAFSEHSPH